MSDPDYADLGRRMHALATRLFPLPRSLAGKPYRQSLDTIEEVTGPIQRHRFPSGEQVFDWTVPPEWEIREAWIKGPDGRKVVDMVDTNLHVVSYSVPIHRRISLDDLQEHLFSLPHQADAIPYRTTYYRRDWGFCLADRVRRELPAGEYEVYIDSELADGHVEVGEVVVPGTSEEEVLLSTYLCHPSMANNELSGPMIVSHLAKLLTDRDPPPRLTYRCVFVPETIGAICYLHRFGGHLREHLTAGYVVTCVGDPGPFSYKRSRRGDTLADRAALHVLGHSGASFRVLDYYPAGSDERQYCSPGFDLPVGSLMRSTYDTFAEYHTSLDDMELVTAEALGDSLRMYHRIAEALEAAQTLEVTMPYGEPQLSPRGLYPTVGAAKSFQQGMRDMMFLLNWCDGRGDLIAAGDRVGRPVWDLAPTARQLLEHDLLRPVPHG